MSKAEKREIIRLLNRATVRARRKIGVWNIKRQALVRQIAEQWNVPFPPSKKAQLELLQRFTADAQPDPPRRRRDPSTQDVNSDAFLLSYEWRRLRMVVLKTRGARCECCGATPKDGVRMHVDHIKPRRLFPQLALTESNLQVLCEVCNHGKGNWDHTDWRADTPIAQPPPRLVKHRPMPTLSENPMSLADACMIWDRTRIQ